VEVQGAVGHEATEEWLVAKDEEDGGEGASLLNATQNRNPTFPRGTHTGGDHDFVKKIADEVDEVSWEAKAGENKQYPVVVDGIKGLLEVERENVVLAFGVESLIETSGEVDNVAVATAAADKAHLLRTDQSIDGRYYRVSGVTGKDAVVSIRDRERACVANSLRLFFRKQVEVAEVKPFGRFGEAGREASIDPEEEGSSDVHKAAVRSEWYPVRASTGVVRSKDSGADGVERGWEDQGGVDMPAIRIHVLVGGAHNSLRRASVPDFAPKVDSNIRHCDGVTRRFRGIIRAKTGKTVAGGGKEEFEARDNVKLGFRDFNGWVISSRHKVRIRVRVRRGERDKVVSEGIFQGV
jgi:hypothetical protein